MTCPVINEPALEANRIAAPMTSSTVPILPKGACSSTCFNISGFSHSSLAKSVLIIPGHKPFIFILNFPNSTAKLLIRPISAVFEIEYAPKFFTPCNPAIEETIIIEELIFL